MMRTVVVIGVIFVLSVAAYTFLYLNSVTGTPPDPSVAVVIVGIVGIVVYGAQWAFSRIRRSRTRDE